MSTLKIDDATRQAIEATTNQSVIDRLLDGKNRIDQWLLKKSDLLSPIVVKECRQALRSKQFLWTFAILLLAIVAWTLAAIIMLMPGIYFLPAGRTLLTGYIVMLFIPAVVIVPLAAFFSMASELNSNTFDVLSISPLTAHRIVLGKVIVAGIQLLLYFSALAPCIALTYLLRGISITDLMMVFPIVIVAAFNTISISVMLATLSKNSFHMVFFLLLNLLICGISLYMALMTVFATLNGAMRMNTDNPVAWFLMTHGILASYGVLAILVGGACIGIAGENYSRRIRIWLAIQGLLIFWMMAFAENSISGRFMNGSSTLAAGVIAILFHWGIAGVFIVTEGSKLSVRSQRTLPNSLTSRLMAIWLSPGSGTGYIFILCNFTAIVVLTFMLYSTVQFDMDGIAFGGAMIAYLAMYLGILRLVMMYIPRGEAGFIALAPLMGGLILSLGCGIPYFISLYLNDFRDGSFEPYCFTNPFWTLSEFDSIDRDGEPIAMLIFTAFLIFCINAMTVCGNVTLVRVKTAGEIDEEIHRKKIATKEASPFES
jgi:hypothetical protein